MTKEIRVNHLKALIQMAGIDKNYADNELRLLIDVGRRLGIEDNEIRALLEEARPPGTSLPDNLMERMAFMYNLLYMMRMDGNLQEPEMALFERVAFRLSLNPVLNHELVEFMKRNANQLVPVQEMQQLIKKYMN